MVFAAFSRLSSALGWWDRPYGDPNVIRAFQSEQLRRLVTHAARNIPYYKRLFREAGLQPDDITEVSDLARIPVSSKRALLETPIEEQITPGTDLASCLVRNSAGSTGEPSVIVRSHAEQSTLRLYALRAALQAGTKPWERRVFIRTDKSPGVWFQRLAAGV
jgi:phenylacetate-CoA ligase